MQVMVFKCQKVEKPQSINKITNLKTQITNKYQLAK